MNNEEQKNVLQDENLKEKATNPVEEYVKELNAKREEMISGKAAAEEKPDYLLPQFKNVEEQAKSYKELQALQTKQAQELAQYKKAREENEQKNISMQQAALLNQQMAAEKQHINDMYLLEVNNLRMALQMGKISEQEAVSCMAKLKDFTARKLQSLDYSLHNNIVNEYSGDMLSPKEFFKDDLPAKNYLSSVSDFLESNYRKMSKKELEGVKNLVFNLEKSLREEILNEKQLLQQNEDYRKNLTSATNLNPQTAAEKIYTLQEIKNMKPDEFRKNQQAILEQFVAHKIK